MGKSSSQKIEVTKYYMAQHFGACLQADALLAITVKEKLAWSGSVTTQTSFVINKGELFGGSSKEGGVQGVVYWLPGANDQVLPDLLAQKLGRANGADAPGYRGLASIFMVGPVGTPFASSSWGDQTKTKRGFYWSANSPYLPGVWIKVRRAPVGLDPDYALIGSTPVEVSGTVEVTWRQNTFVQVDGNDEARMGIAFLDANGNQVGSTEWAAWAQPTVWTERSVSVAAPSGATTLQILMAMQRVAGTNNDGFIDAISATLDGTPITLINAAAETGNTAGWANVIGGIGVRSASPSPYAGSYYFTGGTSPLSIAGQNVGFGNTGADANPAHMIYECLTNTDWGMGSPETAVDKDGFEAAAVVLFGEAFGLSMIWTRQASIQDFIQEVLDHIQAVLYVDPATGLLTLALIRGDYDESTLPILAPDNADLSSFSRKLWGEITNEIVLTWTNPENEQDETVTVQDLASIVTQGGIVSDSRNYYGVRNATLAQKLAQRDLRSAGAPLAICEAEIDRTLWNIRPASVVKLTWPEYGLSEVVFRVTSVDYGKPGEPTIKLSLIEDIYGLDFGDYVEPPSSGWVDPSEDPEPLTIEQVFTLPLFFALNSPAADFVDDPTYPEVVAGILGTTTQDDAFAVDLWDEVTLSNGSLEWQEIGSLNVVGHAELGGALATETTSTGVTFDNQIGDTSPVLAGFVIIGDDGEDGNEIAQIDVVDATYTLRRGLLDTVPRAWPAATPVWFVDDSTLYEDATVRSAGEVADYKLLTRTSQGVLDLADASLVSATLTDRPWLPNRPANVQVEGVDFNTVGTPVDMTGRSDPWVTISWANRNRLLEDSQVLSWTDATVTPEVDQTTKIEVYAEDGTTLLDDHPGNTGTSFNVPDASFGTQDIVLLKAPSERSDDDGDFTSLQAHGIWVRVNTLPPIPEGLGSGTLMIPTGTGGAWDSGGVREIGNVLYDPTDTGKEYKMCYTAYLGAHTDHDEYVGAAYSPDGVTWTKLTPSAPLVSRKSEDPYLLKFGGTYYLYAEDKNDIPFRNIRLQTSTDFVAWTDQGDILDKGAADDWDGADVSSPVVWIDGSTWHMLFEGRNLTNQQGAIGHATSSDGLTWTKDAANPIFVPTNSNWAWAGVSWALSIVPDQLTFEDDGVLILNFHGKRISDNTWVPGVAVGRDLYSFEDALGAALSPTAGDGDLMPLTMFGATQYAYPDPANGVYRAGATAPGAAPSFSVAPAISQADGFVGVGDTLHCTKGTSDGFAPGYQWKRDGAPITGATNASYLLDSADLGATITCTVTVINSGGRTRANSNSLGPVVTPAFTSNTRVPAGDMNGGSDSRLTAGDMQSGTDLRITNERTA